jgi:arsenite methyltransferase
MTACAPLYASDALRTVTGPTLRPGGLALTERAVTFCGLPRGAPVVDVGCGPGASVAYLRQTHGLAAFGIDRCMNFLGEARTRCESQVLIGGHAAALPFANGKLAALLAECVLSLLPAPGAALAEWHRVLKPGGWLVVSDLYLRQSSASCASEEIACCLAGAVDIRTVRKRVTGTGFVVRLFEDHTPLLKRLAAQIVWRHGSLSALEGAVGGCGSMAGRPGYYLMVARKGDERYG